MTTQTTTTRVVNGQRETVTERIVRHPDGSIDRQVLNPERLEPKNKVEQIEEDGAAHTGKRKR